MNWLEYPKTDQSTVVGNLKVLKNFYSPQLKNRRDLLVYLPPSYETGGQRYPVLYMHDGQNLFDNATAHGVEWQIDEILEQLSKEGLEVIVVGIPNAKEKRGAEYSPHRNSQYGGGEADQYLEFLVKTVKPLIDQNFRTLPQREQTGLMGASMGGLISLYGLLQHREIFGFAGVMSPAFWWTEGTFLPWLEAQVLPSSKIYMDVGDNENPELPERRKAYLEDALQAAAILRAKGYSDGNFRFLVEEGGGHHESFWSARFPEALRFLLDTKENP